MTEKRIHSLDGLRGIAALIVVFYHSLLVTPTVWNQVADQPIENPIQWVLSYTPLRIVWAGGEAVWIFFILSGFVLVRPYLAGRKLRVGSYYLRRTIRLYIPFWGSFLFAMAMRSMRHRPKDGTSGWIFLHYLRTNASQAFKTLFLFAGDSTSLNSVWWSLRWEVWFSLALPLVVICARKLRNHGFAFGVVCVAFVAVSIEGHLSLSLFGLLHDNPMLYIPMFGLGVAIAMSEPAIHERFRRCTLPQTVVLAFICSSAMTSTVATLALLRMVDIGGGLAWAIASPFGIGGAAGLVILALAAPPAQRLLAYRPIAWLGVRSYTLYLIHEPLVVTLAVALSITTMTWWWIPFIATCALVATTLIYPIIEAPALWVVRRIPNEPRSGAPQTSAS